MGESRDMRKTCSRCEAAMAGDKLTQYGVVSDKLELGLSWRVSDISVSPTALVPACTLHLSM